MDTFVRAPQEIADRWQSDVVLKRDIFSTIERGHFVCDNGEVDAVLRRIDTAPWWVAPIASHFLKREARALAAAEQLKIAPTLLFTGKKALVRSFIDGVPLHIARPTDEIRFFQSAKAAMRKLHRLGICHNDLAKEQNWLRTPDGRACFTDFQLSICFSGRGKFFRIAAYEDLRHLLKHKRKYAPDSLSAAEWRVLKHKSWLTRVWMATGKKIYYAITRGLFNFIDREGGGTRLVTDAPAIAATLMSMPHVRDAAVVAFPDRRSGTGLYAFIEADVKLNEQNVREFLTGAFGKTKAPEQIQVVEALPRDSAGHIRNEILQLVAMNQIDLIAPLIATDKDRTIVDQIVAGRRNLRDRFNF